MTLIVGPKKASIPAHRLILSAHSEVFRAMLKPDRMREGTTGKVEMPNCTKATVQRLLQYFYTNQITGMDECSVEVRNITLFNERRDENWNRK